MSAPVPPGLADDLDLRGLVLRRETLLAAALVLLLAAIALRFPAFVTASSLGAVFNDSAILIIMAQGQAAVLLTRSVDLSVAANVALTGMAVALIDAHHVLPLGLTILAAPVLGLLLGAFNGLLVWRLGMPPIVVTLGTLTIYRGFAFVLSGGAWINSFQFSPAFLALPRAEWLGVPVLSWIAIAVVAAASLVLGRTAAGRGWFAVGGNPTAAAYAGIDPGRSRFLAFCFSGLLSGLCGYLWVARYAVAYVDLASGFELDVIAACVIGGVSISGGIGSVPGAVLGSLFLGTIKNALPVVNVSPFAQMAISGTIIIAAVALNTRAERRRGRIILRPVGPQAAE
ncbi:rhamnose ABC transporter membrane protein [Methylobacterium phyllostachyos]|uniref:Rhamnose ABC transporter membrane protein n=1 Tax=Methylobacterium phyllostachyos TaxID=582672 RepID=A0A1G9XBR4_9HYPH|nr:ABC transporter permease [Methylobacterium phyllostachyos]SDM93971.1 rhamnose ABC transporter membrane protein [Methylobacterium phyllostachyos]